MKRQEFIDMLAVNHELRGEVRGKYGVMDYFEGYEDSAEYCVVNDDDRNLVPIFIPLPQPPRWDLIDGYGKRKEDQVFEYVEVPVKLRLLEREHDTIDGIWTEIEENGLYYQEEILWIKKQLWHELNGYWFWCNGKPVYLPGDYYVYLNFWNIDVGKPDYRDRDRKIFLFDEYIMRLDNFCGFNYPKHRREGATSKAGFKNYITISRLINSFGGMQSKTEKHVKKVFMDNIIKGWRRLLFVFKPEYDGTDNPKEILNFIPPANTATKNSKGRKHGLLAKEFGLGSNITFASSDVFAYDGSKLHFYHGDEVGKTVEADTHQRYMVIKECLSLGGRFIGHCWNTSTVEEMEVQGGKNFRKTCMQSQFHDVFNNETGRTITGLATLFIPAYEGLEEYIGPYGESIIDDPSERQIDYLRSIKPSRVSFTGAREHIEKERNSYINKGDNVGLMAYKRKYPMEYSDCWISGNFDTGLPHDVILGRMDELTLMKAKKDQKIIRRGNFVKLGMGNYALVDFVDDDKGRFEISYWFKEFGDSNKMQVVNGEAMPMNTHWGLAGGDPFKFSKNKNRKYSDGGGSVFMYQGMTDNSDNIHEWEGHRFVCTYRHKPPTTEEYCRDMANMCQYYGVYMFAENNVPTLNEWFLNNGFRHYLKYMVNKKTGKFEVNPGIYTTDIVHQQLWSLTRDYLRVHGWRECHMDYLQECADIEGVDRMGDYDLFAACGMALLGSEEMMFEDAMAGQSEVTDISGWF